MKIYRASRYRRYQKMHEMKEGYQPRRHRRHQKRRAWGRRTVSFLALILVIAGLGLAAYSLVLGEDSLVPRAVETATRGEDVAASAPEDTTLHLTVPKMARVEDLPVYDAPWDDESALDASAGHIEGSGFPWEDEANVYIAGHRMGFPGTRSFLVFYDLDVLEDGDEIFITDADGTKYTYTVFEKFVADPFDWSPTEVVPGKNIVTLQTCTLPDYSQRLMVHAELTETEPGQGVEPAEKTGPAAPKSEPEPTPELEPTPEFGQGIEPLPDEPLPDEPLPDEPLLDEPLPDEPLPVEAAPVEPLPIEPAPVGPLPDPQPGPIG